MRPLLAFALLIAAGSSAAQADPITFKCLDAKNRVTYSNVRCDKQGLKDGGEVQDRTTTIAAPPKPAAKDPGGSKGAGIVAPKADPEIGPMQSPAQVKPVVPGLEKLTK